MIVLDDNKNSIISDTKKEITPMSQEEMELYEDIANDEYWAEYWNENILANKKKKNQSNKINIISKKVINIKHK